MMNELNDLMCGFYIQYSIFVINQKRQVNSIWVKDKKYININQIKKTQISTTKFKSNQLIYKFYNK